MKKAILLLAVALITGQVSMTAMAHGHRGGYRQSASVSTNTSTVTYSMCSVEGCNITGVHSHDGTYYCGHYAGDGHDYHAFCGVQGCTQTGAHNHGGYYGGGHHSGGHH